MYERKVKLKESGKIGLVTEVFPNLFGQTVLIVEFENGEKEKCFETDVEYLNDEAEDKPEEVEEVTISKDQFRDLVIAKSLELAPGNFSVGLALTAFGSELSREIFKKKADHD